MARKRHAAGETIGELCEAEALIARGKTIAEAARATGVAERSCLRWREERGGLKLDQARRLEEPGREDARLRGAIADPGLGKLILKEAASGNR